MGDWVKTGSHDWRDERHNLAHYGVEVYVNLKNGDRTFIYNDRAYYFDEDKKRFELLEPAQIYAPTPLKDRKKL